MGCAEIVTDGVFVGDEEIVTDGVFVGDAGSLAAAALIPEAVVVSSEPAAPCGHHTTRQAARASSAATPMRTKFVLAVLTTSSKNPTTERCPSSPERYLNAGHRR